MNAIIWIAMTLSIPLLAAQSYMPADLQHDFADMEIADSGSVRITMQLPTSHEIYVEVFGRTNLLEGQWQVLDSWITCRVAADLFRSPEPSHIRFSNIQIYLLILIKLV